MMDEWMEGWMILMNTFVLVILSAKTFIGVEIAIREEKKSF